MGPAGGPLCAASPRSHADGPVTPISPAQASPAAPGLSLAATCGLLLARASAEANGTGAAGSVVEDVPRAAAIAGRRRRRGHPPRRGPRDPPPGRGRAGVGVAPARPGGGDPAGRRASPGRGRSAPARARARACRRREPRVPPAGRRHVRDAGAPAGDARPARDAGMGARDATCGTGLLPVGRAAARARRPGRPPARLPEPRPSRAHLRRDRRVVRLRGSYRAWSSNGRQGPSAPCSPSLGDRRRALRRVAPSGGPPRRVPAGAAIAAQRR